MDTIEAHGPATDDDLPGEPVSLWIATTPETGFPRMAGDISVDVAVLGGGIAGIATAFQLKQSGMTVAVIEADRVVKSVTGNTTAKILRFTLSFTTILSPNLARKTRANTLWLNRLRLRRSQLLSESTVLTVISAALPPTPSPNRKRTWIKSRPKWASPPPQSRQLKHYPPQDEQYKGRAGQSGAASR